MATQAAEVVGSNAWSFARFVDRWIYAFIAALFVATTLIGFVPNSVEVLAAVEAGRRPPLPPILHVHAVLMGSWLLLLLAQTTLAALGRTTQHRKLGVIAFVLAPALLIALVVLVKTLWSQLASLPPGVMAPDALSAAKFIVTNILLEQIRAGILFAAFVAWALLVRKHDPETHKRAMILAALTPMTAAFGRMDWLPQSLPDSPSMLYVSLFIWLLPALIYDMARRGRVHRVYVIGIAVNLPFVAAAILLWGSAWWTATAPALMGVQGW